MGAPKIVMRLLEDRLTPGARLTCPGALNRAFYVVEGAVTIADATEERRVRADDAVRTVGDASLQAGADGALVWRFEIALATTLPSADTPAGATRLEVEVELPEADGYLLRCERADFVLGAVTPKHTHRGPGMRCLLRGELEGEIGTAKTTYRPGDAWLERGGAEPVIGRSSPTLATSFVRVMVLPKELRGETSFLYWDASEEGKPRAGAMRTFFDDTIDL